jgi:hypothetical protein
MADPESETPLADKRGTKDRRTQDKAISGKEVILDTGLGPARVVAVVKEKPVPPIHKQLAAWVNADIRQQIRVLEQAGIFSRESLVQRPHRRYLRRFERPAREGNIVVWIGLGPHNVEAQIYREFPEDGSVYLEATRGDKESAQLLLESYSQFNRDFWHLIHDLGLSVEQARTELRRIDDEVFRLVLEAAATILNAGTVLGTIRAFADRIVKALRAERGRARPRPPSRHSSRSGREPHGDILPSGYLNQAKRAAKRLMEMFRKEKKPVKVDIGGKADRDYINLNPDLESAGPFPNWVKAFGEDLGELFPPGSVEEIISENLVPPPNWQKIAQGSFKVLKPGGKVGFHQFNAPAEGVTEGITKALLEAGFEVLSKPGDLIVLAVRPR